MANQTQTLHTPETFDIFVYGSLKRGFSGYHHLEGATFLGTAVTADKFYLTSNQYPFLSKSKQHCYVKGECFKVGKEMLAKLDEYEEVPEYYTRETIQIVMDDTKEVKDVQVYFCEKEMGQKIHEDGHYLEEPTIVKCCC